MHTRSLSKKARNAAPQGKKPLFRDFFLCYLSLANLQMLPEGSSSVAVGKAFLFCQSETQKQTKPKQKRNKTEKNKQGSEGRGRAFLQTHTLSLQMQIRGPWKDGPGPAVLWVLITVGTAKPASVAFGQKGDTAAGVPGHLIRSRVRVRWGPPRGRSPGRGMGKETGRRLQEPGFSLWRLMPP